MAAVGIASPSLSPNSPSAVSPKSTPQEAGSPIHEAEVEVISTTPASSVKSRACDACRRRKSKCVYAKERLECDACVSYRLECTFAADLQPRKRKSSVESDEVRPSKQRYHIHSLQWSTAKECLMQTAGFLGLESKPSHVESKSRGKFTDGRDTRHYQ